MPGPGRPPRFLLGHKAIDHVVPISAGWFGDAAKSQVLCGDRHGVKSARERRHKNAEVESCP
jgi:hypothetical protein